jgi:hypothetical protein
VVTQGQTETATAHVRPLARVTFTVSYAGVSGGTSASMRADRTGAASFPFVVTAGPRGRQSVLDGQVMLRVTAPGSRSALRAHFSIYPPLQLAVTTNVTQQQGLTVLGVKVRITRRARISASVALAGNDDRVITSSGVADGHMPLTLWLPLGRIHAGVHISVDVRAVSTEGITLQRHIPVAVDR